MKICPVCGDHIPKPKGKQIYCRACIGFANAAVFRVSGKSAACALVGKAVKQGIIKPAVGQACVDCGAPATDLDHRDYNKPLDVVPVCHPCNILRGPAKWVGCRDDVSVMVRMMKARYPAKWTSNKTWPTLAEVREHRQAAA